MNVIKNKNILDISFSIYCHVYREYFCSLIVSSYSEEPRPEYAPKKNNVSKPPAASPPIVATIQRGTLPISLILIIKNKKGM